LYFTKVGNDDALLNEAFILKAKATDLKSQGHVTAAHNLALTPNVPDEFWCIVKDQFSSIPIF